MKGLINMEETYIKITKANIIFKYEHWGFVPYEILDEHQEIKELRDKNLTLIYQAPLFTNSPYAPRVIGGLTSIPENVILINPRDFGSRYFLEFCLLHEFGHITSGDGNEQIADEFAKQQLLKKYDRIKVDVIIGEWMLEYYQYDDKIDGFRKTIPSTYQHREKTMRDYLKKRIAP